MALPSNSVFEVEDGLPVVVPRPVNQLKDLAVTKNKKIWSAEFVSPNVLIKDELGVTQYTVLATGCERLGFALDANDDYWLAIQTSTGGYIKSATLTVTLPNGLSDIVCNTDYPPEILVLQQDIRDVVVAYLLNGNLYCRYQRENYAIERLLRQRVRELKYMCLNEQWRLQFGAVYEPLTDP